MKILIVDDQNTNRKLLCAELESEGHEVCEAADGVEALKALESQPFEAVISDVLMPNMDGYRLCHEVRGRARIAKLPFIIYTNIYDSPSDRQLGETVGADDYIVRPAAAKAILESIGNAQSRAIDRNSPRNGVRAEYILEQYSTALVSKLEHKNLELVRANGELQIIRDQLQHLLIHSPVVIYSFTVDGREITPRVISGNVKRMLGFEPGEVTYDWWVDRLHPEDRQRAIGDPWEPAQCGEQVAQWRIRHKQGHYVWVENTRRVLRDVLGNPVEITGVWTDINERKQAEERLREQASLLDIASDAIFVEDMEGRIQYWSKGAERIFGWNAGEVRGRRAEDLLSKDDFSSWQTRQSLLKNGEWSGECRRCTRDGREIDLMSRWTLLRNEDGQPKAVLSINSDITEKKKMEAQFLRVQRLESIGTLASGIAHDLNNVLTPIVMCLSLLQEKVSDAEAREMLQSLAQNAMRGSEIIKQVLAFGRGMKGQRVPVDLRHVVREIQKIVSETFTKSIQLQVSIEHDLWAVTGDPTQLHQVLLNLCINARDAMPHGGRLGVRARNIDLDENYVALNPGSRVGHFVLLEVEDNGVGIPENIRDRIFEPFFTTKELGRGTGLGLSTVVAILKSHEGFLKLYSEEGKGSVFKAYLPATPLEQPAIPQNDTVQLPRGNGEWILLVDDEDLIINVAKKTLERFGYQVLPASDGAIGVALYAQHRTEIAVVITDMVMPLMDGTAMTHALLRINPKVKIIAASGFGSENGVVKAVEAGVRHHLQKPYTTETLLNLVHQLIHEDERKAS